ncbi:MAG: hypothetical protein H7251_10585 [Acetobacteraceae bacterium]|nr:hypothetical protein [Acetobacteraceae bacterium]
MNTSPVFPPLSIAAPELVRRLGQILAELAAVVAARFLRRPHLMGLTVLLWSRLSRAAQRFGRVMTRPRKQRSPRTDRRVYRTRSAAGLPQGRGWLVRELGYEAVAFGCQLEALLAEPAMQAALVARPAAGRILRPLCRMLGVPFSALPPVVVQVLAASVPIAVDPAAPASITPNCPDAVNAGALRLAEARSSRRGLVGRKLPDG